MSNGIRQFKTGTPEGSYTSTAIRLSMQGYRTGVFQGNAYTGDNITLQGRLDESCPWVDILEIADSPTIIEVVLCPIMRIVVSNSSTQDTTSFITE
jgi:hypothetical protein